ncbi:MAG: hypothetical protein M1813_009441 [Trichoglossum hirsutum]|nr:MAG: hypothetical protein M1813_009441 [Trichoglossum hirsutum]
MDLPVEYTVPQTVSITKSKCATLFLSRLPAEIRFKIYRHVLDDCGSESNCFYVVTDHPRCDPLPSRWRWLNTDNVPEDKYEPDRGIHHVHFHPRSNIAFLRTCRQIWLEASSAMLDERLISFENIEGFFRYQYHVHIRRLELVIQLSPRSSAWESKAWLWFCKIAADEMKLTQLTLWITLDYVPSITLQALWLKPLFRVRGLKSFDIHLRCFGPHRLKELRILEDMVRGNMLGPRVDWREFDDEKSQLLAHLCRGSLYITRYTLY